MRRPFDVHVQCDDAAIATAIARSLEPMLAARGARARVTIGRRALPGATVAIGVRSEEEGARWLSPIDVPPRGEEASAHIASFLERWGFVEANPASAQPGR